MQTRDILWQMLDKTTAHGLRDLLPLIESAYRSEAILTVLQGSLSGTVESAERELASRIGVFAFGSLGRLEFVQGTSDLDVMIVYEPKDGVRQDPETLRRLVLEPLARLNPWLAMDDREVFLDQGWGAVSNVDLKYPVYRVEDLLEGADAMSRCRQWQALFESRCLYGQALHAIVLDGAGSNAGERPEPRGDAFGPQRRPRQPGKILREAREFFASFENPALLYKKSAKYWKTRFLREFFTFSTILTLILDWYFTTTRVPSPAADSLTGPVVSKLFRIARMGAEALDAPTKNRHLEVRFEKALKFILAEHGISRDHLLIYGASYRSALASTYFGLVLATLARFASCWQKVYDPNVLRALDAVPLTFNPDATVLQRLDDQTAAYTVEELIALRKSYRRHMSATACAFQDLIGVLCHGKTEPPYVTDALRLFKLSTSP